MVVTPRPSRPRRTLARVAGALLVALGVSAAALAVAPGAAAASTSRSTGATSSTAVTASAPTDTRAMRVWDTSTPTATVDLAVS
ncbi:MAG: hypothetical protein HOQ21_09415, partial [Dermatophilaceae bacterium]|nr:hypothetical protein [Dermatophilaceae bacterium]